MLSDKVKVASLAKYGDSYCRTIIAIETVEEGEAVWWYDPSGGNELETFYTWSDIANEPDASRRTALKIYSYMVGNFDVSEKDRCSCAHNDFFKAEVLLLGTK